MSDKEAVDAMAKLWLAKGKDSKGFSWFMWDVLKQIKQLEKAKKEEEIW